MKILLLLTTLFIFATNCYSQDTLKADKHKSHYFGVRGGITMSIASRSNYNAAYEQLSSVARYHFYGVYTHVRKYLYISPEVGVSSKGYTSRVNFTDAQGNNLEKIRQIYATTAVSINGNVGGYIQGFYPFASIGMDMVFSTKKFYGQNVGGQYIGWLPLNDRFRVAPVIGFGAGYHIKAKKRLIPFQVRYDYTIDDYSTHSIHISTGVLF